MNKWPSLSRASLSCAILDVLTLWALTLQNIQPYSNNSSATANELFECLWPICGVDTERVKISHAGSTKAVRWYYYHHFTDEVLFPVINMLNEFLKTSKASLNWNLPYISYCLVQIYFLVTSEINVITVCFNYTCVK